MSGLDAFLNPAYTQETVEIVISDRFLDENGKPVPFKLRSLSQNEMQRLQKKSYTDQMVNGKKSKVLDEFLYLDNCLVESVIYPNFKAHELCERYGTEDPVTLPRLMLLKREYEKLARAMMKLNGVDDDDIDLGEVTKN